MIVLFGGYSTTIRNDLHCCQDPLLDDTWTWDGRSWTSVPIAAKPPTRYLAMMVWDDARHEVVLFGGQGLDHASQTDIVFRNLADTWTWDGTTWTRKYPVHSPPPLATAVAAYDPVHQVVVLFGSRDNYPFGGQTWTWDGTDWTQLRPANVPGTTGQYELSGMVYHAPSGGLILLTFQDGSAVTWVFNGDTWTKLLPVSPGAPADPNVPAPRLALDPASGNLIYLAADGSTWRWDAAAWVRLHPSAAPPPPEYGPLASDSAHGQIVTWGASASRGVAGGPSDFATTWTWNGQTWSAQAA